MTGWPTMSSRFIDWEEWDDQLGKMPDAILAAKMNCSMFSVVRRRKKLGIMPFGRIPKQTDFSSVNDMLGKKPDEELAKIIGVSKETVAAHRKKMGIKAYKKDAIKWELATGIIGVKNDTEVARIVGCSIASVRERRLRLGIEAPKLKGRPKGSVLYDLKDIKKNSSVQTIASQLGCSLTTASKYKKLTNKSSKAKWSEQELLVLRLLPFVACRVVLKSRTYDAIRRKVRELGIKQPDLNSWIKTMAEKELGFTC